MTHLGLHSICPVLHWLSIANNGLHYPGLAKVDITRLSVLKDKKIILTFSIFQPDQMHTNRKTKTCFHRDLHNGKKWEKEGDILTNEAD